jgi:hypothetical protein
MLRVHNGKASSTESIETAARVIYGADERSNISNNPISNRSKNPFSPTGKLFQSKGSRR